MRYLRSTTSLLRRFILFGWALAVIWIYLGNLVNFHQNRIWGKQLIPVACSSTRAKEKEDSAFVKDTSNTKLLASGLQFDFSSPDAQVIDILYCGFISTVYSFPDTPVISQGIQAFSFRGPPSA